MNQKRKAILVIEDNHALLEATAEIIELSGFIVHTANSGWDGVQQARIHCPDVILCDIMMPDLDGYQVLNILNRNESTANIPFIFLTSKAGRADFRKGMDMGADDYLIKPFDDTELVSAINSRLQKRERLLQCALSLNSLETLLDEARAANILVEQSENSRLRTFRKKQIVYVQGEQPQNIFLVKSGKIRTYRIYSDGREIVTGIYSEGDFFGFEAVLLNRSYSDNTEALDTSELYLVPANEFNTLFFKDIRIAKKFIGLLSGNLEEKQEQLLKLAYNTVRKRVADALISLAEKFCQNQQEECKIKISRDGLAAIVGTAIESVSRTLTDFKEEHLIEKEGNTIKILSIEGLKKIK
ncbi:response regulator [Desertivirga xinjiangensis]|uniref:response regulator n=1 Tax=Desertivirga xinjiangensis TaxID=539206 RepID=UPI00210AF695|nr:response regulator [Pedobacter xinjiangensis]